MKIKYTYIFIVIVTFFLSFELNSEDLKSYNKVLNFIKKEYLKNSKIYLYQKQNKKIIEVKGDKNFNICLNTEYEEKLKKQENLKEMKENDYVNFLVKDKNLKNYNLNKYSKNKYYIINNEDCMSEVLSGEFEAFSSIKIKEDYIIVNSHYMENILVKKIYKFNGKDYKKIKELWINDEHFNDF